MKFGAVAIGRNEGERLKRCLASLSGAATVVYVDSGSSDGSAAWARDFGAEVVELDMRAPFTAARARNAGLKRLREIAPELVFVQFIDGDCELDRDWPRTALAFLHAHADVAAVTGRLRERHPERSVYNWLCQREWESPAGETRACGGIAMMKLSALRDVGGYRNDVMAAEDDELCIRLRLANWRIWRVDAPMAVHDAAMTRISQWWQRATRGGYGYAHGVHLHGDPPECHFVWELRRTWIWGIALPLAGLAATMLWFPWGSAFFLAYPAQVLRQTFRNRGTIRERITLSLFQILGRFAEATGAIRFLGNRLLGRTGRLIEYK